MAVEAGGLFLFLQFCQDVSDAEFKCQFQLIAHQVPGVFSYSEIAAMGKCMCGTHVFLYVTGTSASISRLAYNSASSAKESNSAVMIKAGGDYVVILQKGGN